MSHLLLCQDRICQVSVSNSNPAETPHLEIPIFSENAIEDYILELRLSLDGAVANDRNIIPCYGLAEGFTYIQPKDSLGNNLDFSLTIDKFSGYDVGIFDIQIPLLSEGYNKIYLWEVEIETSPVSIDSLYVFVDNFTGNDEDPPDASKWDVSGTPTILNTIDGGLLRMSDGDSITAKGLDTDNLMIRAFVSFENLSLAGPRMQLVGKDDPGVYTALAGLENYYYPDPLDGTHHTYICNTVNGTDTYEEYYYRWWRFNWYDVILNVDNNGTKLNLISQNTAEQLGIITSAGNTADATITLRTWEQNNNMRVRFIKAQPYVDVLPFVTTPYLRLPGEVDTYVTEIFEEISIEETPIALTGYYQIPIELNDAHLSWFEEENFAGWIGQGGSNQIELDDETYTLLQFGHESGGYVIYPGYQNEGSWKIKMRFDDEYLQEGDIQQHFSIMFDGYGEDVTLKISNTSLSLYYWNGMEATYIMSTSITPGDEYHLYEVIRIGNDWTVKMDDVVKGTGTLNAQITYGNTYIGLHLLSDGYYGAYTEYVEMSNPTVVQGCNSVITETKILQYVSPLAYLGSQDIDGVIKEVLIIGKGTVTQYKPYIAVITSDDSLKMLNLSTGELSSSLLENVISGIFLPSDYSKIYALTETRLYYLYEDENLEWQTSYRKLPKDSPHYIGYYCEQFGGGQM